MLQGRDVGDFRMNVRPAQGAGADDVERPRNKTPVTRQRGLVCAKLSAGLTLIRKLPIAPAQYILFFIVYT